MCLPFWIWEEGKINSDKTRMEKKRHAWFGLDVKRTKKPITLTFEDKTKLAILICKYYSGIYEKVISSKLKWQSLANTSMSTIK